MATQNKTNATIGFEQQLWNAANILRNKINAADYRKVITGLIFLKYVSDAFEKKYEEIAADEYKDPEDKDEYIGEHVFFIPKKARWSQVQAFALQEKIGVKIDEAMREIEKENNELKNVLPKIYASSDIDKAALGEVVNLKVMLTMPGFNI